VVYAVSAVNAAHPVVLRPLEARVWAFMAADDQLEPVVTQECLQQQQTVCDKGMDWLASPLAHIADVLSATEAIYVLFASIKQAHL
jgi:hypothetical protein